MSWNDEHFMQRGFRVRHKYARARGKTKTCVLCGVKRRRASSGWLYSTNGGPYATANPPCVRKERS